MIAAGRKDKRVTLEQVTTAKDSYNQGVETWSTLATVWAAIAPVRGREAFAARQFSSEEQYTITINYRADVTTKMRVKYGSRYFRIESKADPLERHEDLELSCVEVQP